MMENTKENSRSYLSKSTFKILVSGIGVLFLLFALASRRPALEDNPSATESSPEMKKNNAVIIKSASIEGKQPIPSYQCSRSTADKHLDVILLHGAAFTKENWKESGILQQFCDVSRLRVSALDLDNGSNHEDLKAALMAMRSSGMIDPVEKVAIVTPSASGFSMVDWAKNDKDGMLENVEYWIPVACPAVKSAESHVLEGMKSLKILAVYGTKDGSGVPRSKPLEQYANAKLIEIEGRHPCYLDSPRNFVDAVVGFLE